MGRRSDALENVGIFNSSDIFKRIADRSTARHRKEIRSKFVLTTRTKTKTITITITRTRRKTVNENVASIFVLLSFSYFLWIGRCSKASHTFWSTSVNDACPRKQFYRKNRTRSDRTWVQRDIISRFDRSAISRKSIWNDSPGGSFTRFVRSWKGKGRKSVEEKCLRRLYERVSKSVASLTSEDVSKSLFKR